MFLLCPAKHDSEVCHLDLKLSSTGPKLEFADIRILPSIPGRPTEYLFCCAGCSLAQDMIHEHNYNLDHNRRLPGRQQLGGWVY